jgi:hypothetical protein
LPFARFAGKLKDRSSSNMFQRKPKGGLVRAAQALSAANGVAHLVFLSLFGWRLFFSGPLSKMAALPCALFALLGLVTDLVGWSLVKHGGKTRVRKFGLWAVAASTAISAVLLVVSSLTG